MSNLTSQNPSLDGSLNAWGQYGGMVRFLSQRVTATTGATITSGYIPGQRCNNPFVVPSVGSGVQGYCLTLADIYQGSNNDAAMMVCLEYLLGTITLNGNVFSNAGSMPTKKVLGTSMQTASSLALLVTTTSGTASAPVITITYTNQDGTTGQTATLTLPNSPAVESAFLINPYLASNDSGIRAVTNISSSVTTGTSVMSVYGCLVLASTTQAAVQSIGGVGSADPLITPTLPMYLCAAGESINTYTFGPNTAGDRLLALAFCPEPN